MEEKEELKNKNISTGTKILKISLMLLLVLVLVLCIYIYKLFHTYYKAEEDVLKYLDSDDNVSVSRISVGYYFKNSNLTKDFYRRVVGHGNLLVSLITQAEIESRKK